LETMFKDFGITVTVSSEKTSNAEKYPLSAFIFINCEPQEPNNALQDLKNVDGVDEVYRSRGVYDLVAKISAESVEDMRQRVLKEIKNVAFVKSTLTLLVIDSK
jgi:DNA-binding Lrp family transcriptional regulator